MSILFTVGPPHGLNTVNWQCFIIIQVLGYGVFSILIASVDPGAAQIELTTSVLAAGRQLACIGETVTYTCSIASGEVLVWTAPPAVVDNNPIFFFASASTTRPGATAYEGDILAILTSYTQLSTSPAVVGAFTSDLIFKKPFQNAVITCRNETTSAAVSVVHRLADADNLLPPPNNSLKIIEEAIGSADLNLLTLEWFTVNISWGNPINVDDIDFSDYLIQIFSSEGTQSMTLRSNDTSLLVPLTVGTYDVEISVIDQCGNIGRSVPAHFTLSPMQDPAIQGLTAIAVILIVACLAVIAISITCAWKVINPKQENENEK